MQIGLCRQTELVKKEAIVLYDLELQLGKRIRRVNIIRESFQVFFAGGIFNYFNEDKIYNLCKSMAERFPRGELVFDAPSNLGNKIMNRKLKKSDVKGINFDFALNNPVQFSKLSDRIQVIDWFTLFARTLEIRNGVSQPVYK